MSGDIIARLKATITRHQRETGKTVALANQLHSQATQSRNRVAAELAGTSGVREVVADYDRAIKAAEEARAAGVAAETRLRQMLDQAGSI